MTNRTDPRVVLYTQQQLDDEIERVLETRGGMSLIAISVWCLLGLVTGLAGGYLLRGL